MKTGQQPYFILLNPDAAQQALVDYNADHWLRLLSGAGWYQPETGRAATVQPERSINSGTNAEIIGRTDYPLYRS